MSLLTRHLFLPWQDHRAYGLLMVLLSPESQVFTENRDETQRAAVQEILMLARDRVRGQIGSKSQLKLVSSPYAFDSPEFAELRDALGKEKPMPAAMYLLTPHRWHRVRRSMCQEARAHGMTPMKFLTDRVTVALFRVAEEVIKDSAPGETIATLRRKVGSEVARDLRTLGLSESKRITPMSLATEAERIEYARAAAGAEDNADAATLRAALEPEQRRSMLRRAGLSPREVDVICRFRDGEHLNAMAAKMRTQPSTVRTTFMRARNKLRRLGPDRVRELVS